MTDTTNEVRTLTRVKLLGYEVIDEPAFTVASSVCEQLQSDRLQTFAFLNPHSIVLARSDKTLKASITRCSGILCDGAGLALASRILRRAAIHRVYGYEFFQTLSKELSRRRQGRIFFLGGDKDSLQELVSKYRREFPGVQQIDSFAPAYKSEFSEADLLDMEQRIRAAAANVLWIGLGSPKQEKLLHRLASGAQVKCTAAVGAVFDFYIGRVPNAPPLIRRLGLEWAHRLIREPRRLWRRTFISAPLFLLHVAKEFRFSKNKQI